MPQEKNNTASTAPAAGGMRAVKNFAIGGASGMIATCFVSDNFNHTNKK
jgi:hypothetical protein